jgi:hypothetical protein
LDSRLTILLCKRITVAKSKEVKTGYRRAESSKEGCGSKRTGLPMMMVVMMMMILLEMKNTFWMMLLSTQQNCLLLTTITAGVDFILSMKNCAVEHISSVLSIPKLGELQLYIPSLFQPHKPLSFHSISNYVIKFVISACYDGFMSLV